MEMEMEMEFDNLHKLLRELDYKGFDDMRGFEVLDSSERKMISDAFHKSFPGIEVKDGIAEIYWHTDSGKVPCAWMVEDNGFYLLIDEDVFGDLPYGLAWAFDGCSRALGFGEVSFDTIDTFYLRYGVDDTPGFGEEVLNSFNIPLKEN